MKLRRSPLLIVFAVLATFASAQSLVEMAKKEKERRKKNDKEEVRVLDNESLQTGEPSTSDAHPSDDNSSYKNTREERSTPSKTESPQERRERCDAELARAKAEKEDLQKRYDAGVSSTATAPGDQLRATNGRGIAGTGAPDVRVGGRTACAKALKEPEFYADAAAKCRALQSRIDAAEAKIRAANDCYRKR